MNTGKLISFILLMSALFVSPCHAITLLVKDEALRYVLPEADEYVSENKIVNDAQLDKIKSRLGGMLAAYTKGENTEEIINQREFTFYFGVKGGQRIGAAIMLQEPGKWGAIDFMVSLDIKGTVTNVVVMKFVENRGRPIARRSFLSQFIGKTSSDALKVGKDVTAVSGATVSTGAVIFAVKKAIILYEELILKK